MSFHLRDNKAIENNKTAFKRLRSTSLSPVNRTIQPELLQQAMKNPQDARPEAIIQLQHIVGNQEINRLVEQRARKQSRPPVNNLVQGSTPPVQRSIDFNFSAHVGIRARLTKPHDKDFRKIMSVFEKYKKSKTTAEEYQGLMRLIKLCGDWLFKYAEKYKGRNKEVDLRRLLNLCQAELMQVSYMHKMEAGEFEFLTTTGSSAHNHTSEEQKFAGQHKLTKSELTAIKVYTAGDYDYINPTFAKDEDWLNKKIKKLAGPTISNIKGKQVQFPSQWQSKGWRGQVENEGASPEQKKQIKQEAKQHGQMAVEGLKKLPNWTEGAVYRGMGLPDEKIRQEYQVGKTVTYHTFTSTTDKPQTASNFAADNSTDERVGMFFTINTINGKDITRFSEVKSESEILLLPESTFTVDDIQPPDDTHNFYRITLTQTS